MKKLVKKLSVVLFIVIMIILPSQVMGSSMSEPVLINISKEVNIIRYILKIILLFGNLIIAIISIIKAIKIKDKKVIIKYFVYIILVALLLIASYWIYDILTLNGGIQVSPSLAIFNLILLLILYAIPTILNIILYTHINKNLKKLKEGGESKCQE